MEPNPIGGTIFWIILIVGYCLPISIAMLRNHARVGSIMLVNLFLGWSLIGWLVALVWALGDPRTTSQRETDQARAIVREQKGVLP